MREFKYIITKEDSDNKTPIKNILRQNFSFSSRLRSKIKKNKTVFLNGETVLPWISAKEGDLLTVKIPDEVSLFTPENIPIVPLFEDEDLLIVDKPAGFIVHPTKGHPGGTIANGVAKYMIDTDQSFKIRFINRLDMDTSGILALAKNSHARDDFVKQAKGKKVEKVYTAVVNGIIKKDFGTIDLPIGRPDANSVGRKVMADGAPSITHYRVLEKFKKGYTLVELLLETGRTHQIRVHLSHLGYPIVGDFLYGGEKVYLIERQALHASRLSFDHPFTKNSLVIKSDIPDDMGKLIKLIK